MFPFPIVIASIHPGWKLVFSGTTSNSATNPGTTATAEFKFDTDGYVYSRDNLTGGYTQVGQWIDDVSKASVSGAELRWTGLSGAAMTFATTAEDSWHDITASDLILYLSTTTNPQSVSNGFTMQVRDAADVTQDSEIYGLDAEST